MSSSGGVRKRTKPAAASSSAVGNAGAGSAGILRFYGTDDAPGLKIGPTTVLVLSLLFIGFVVLLHIYGKITSSK